MFRAGVKVPGVGAGDMTFSEEDVADPSRETGKVEDLSGSECDEFSG